MIAEQRELPGEVREDPVSSGKSGRPLRFQQAVLPVKNQPTKTCPRFTGVGIAPDEQSGERHPPDAICGSSGTFRIIGQIPLVVQVAR